MLPSGRYCDYCFRNAPEFLRPCTRCAQMDHLNRDRLCKRCRTADLLDTVFTRETLTAQPKLAVLYEHLKAAQPSYVLQIRRQSHVWTTIVKVAALREPVTHAHLDEMASARAISQLRSLLVQLGVLEERDEYGAAFQKVAAREIATLPHRKDQLALRRYIRRRRLYRERAEKVTVSQAANDRYEVRVILSLIRAINADGDTIETARQKTLDDWAAHASAAFRVRRFVKWCADVGLNRQLIAPPASRLIFSLGGRMSTGNENALRQALTEETHSPRMRLAVLLTTVYAVRVHRIAELRRDTLRLVEGQPRLRLGRLELELPMVSAPWVAAILDGISIRHRVGGSRRDETWIFPGYRHNDHMLASSLATKLRAIGVSPARAHQASAAALITQVPTSVIARLLGISLNTASEWHAIAGSTTSTR